MKDFTRRTERLASAALVLAVAACGGVSPPSGAAPRDADLPSDAAQLPSGHPVVAAAPLEESQPQAPTVAGSVVELLDGGGYTYARIAMAESDEEIWVAGPATPMTIGQEVEFARGVSMGRFSSPTLNRTFEDLYFVGAFAQTGPPADASNGAVLEVLAGGGYTYVRVDTGSGELWLAAPEASPAVTDTVHWQGGMDMGRFSSPTLNKTFERIVFVQRIWVSR